MSNYEHVKAALESGDVDGLLPSSLILYLTAELADGNAEVMNGKHVTEALSAAVLPDLLRETGASEPSVLTEEEVLDWMASIGCHEDDELQMSLVGAIIDL